MARKFMYVCLGILVLAIAYSLGATAAISQGTGMATGVAAYEASGGSAIVFAVTDAGDCYKKVGTGDWQPWGNIFGATLTQPTTWGQIKAEFGE